MDRIELRDTGIPEGQSESLLNLSNHINIITLNINTGATT